VKRSAKNEKAKTYLDLFGYSEEQVLGDWFPSEPAQPKRGE
jgi:hypothetical protein